MEPFIIAEPHVTEVDLIKEDQFLILACDGVWVKINIIFILIEYIG